MPRKQRQARPSEFASDGEEEEVSNGYKPMDPTSEAPPFMVVDMSQVTRQDPAPFETTPPIPVLKEVERHVATDKLSRAPAPPGNQGSAVSAIDSLANLVLILHQTKAGVKGRIDDTGRFELKFDLNRKTKRQHDNEVDPPSPTRSVSSSSQGGRSPYARKTIGWTRPR